MIEYDCHDNVNGFTFNNFQSLAQHIIHYFDFKKGKKKKMRQINLENNINFIFQDCFIYKRKGT